MKYFVTELRNEYMCEGTYLAKSAEENLSFFLKNLHEHERVVTLYTKGEGKSRSVVVVTSIDV